MMEFVECPHCGKNVRMDALLRCVRPVGEEKTDDLVQGAVRREVRCMCPECEGGINLLFAGPVEYIMMDWDDAEGAWHSRDLFRRDGQ